VTLRFGYKASAEQFSPQRLLDLAVLAEQSGFDSVAVSDHFQPWRHTQGHAPFSFAWLGAAGQRTSRVTLGTSVVTPTFRYHPAVVAQAAATLACLTPGRFWLGVGSGEALNEAPLLGSWPDSAERFARLREAVQLIKLLWGEDRVTFEGRFYSVHNATLYDRPAEPPPLYIAASGPAAARLAGRLADGLICTSGKGREHYTQTLLPALREGLEATGRDAGSVQTIIEMKVSFDTDAARALQDTRQWAALALSAEEKRDVDDPLEMERLASVLSAEQAASRWIVSHDADEHVQRIADYIEMGFSHLIFHAPGEDQERFMRLYAEQVLPRLRAMKRTG
jgi:coenzyme F420-dependent glucose-6-phosphate dehydrogenase